MSTSIILAITVAEPVFLLISGYTFARFAQFFHGVPNKRSSSVLACLLVVLHAAQAAAEVGTAWCATTGVVEVNLNLGLNLTQTAPAIASIILVQMHYSSLVYFMIKRRTCWLVVATFLTILMVLISIGTIILLIITKSSFNPASAIESKNSTIRISSLMSIISYFGGNVLFDGTICTMISLNLIRSGSLNLGTRMRTVVRNLLLLTLRTFLLTTVLMSGLAVVTLSAILPRSPNPQLVKGIPLLWIFLTSLLSRVYILSFFSSFVGKSKRNATNHPSPQFLNSFKIKTSQFTESNGTTAPDHYPEGPRIHILTSSQ